MYIVSESFQMFIFALVLSSAVRAMEEPQCISRYDYDFKLLKQMLAFEKTQEDFEKTQQELQDTIQRLEGELDALQKAQWDNWSEWGDCFTDCKGSARGRTQTRTRVTSGPNDKQSQSESRPCNAVQFAGCVTPSNDANDNYGVTYDFADQLAQSTCTAMSKGGHVNAVRRTCVKTADTCDVVCKSIGTTCFNSLHVYRGSPVLNRTDVAKKGLLMYKYNSCGGGCGPNFCCCNSS